MGTSDKAVIQHWKLLYFERLVCLFVCSLQTFFIDGTQLASVTVCYWSSLYYEIVQEFFNFVLLMLRSI